MSHKRKALGRGITSLIPTEKTGGSDEVQFVDINAIDTNPYQPRIDFDEGEIAGLAASIKNQGLLQPIVLRKKGARYEIISGERRFRAFRFLKRISIPCIVKINVSDKEMLELALVENIQREQLNEIEKALAYRKLIDEFKYTHEELAKQVGKSRVVVTNCLRLLNLPEEIQQMVRKNDLSAGHARAILALDTEEKQLEAAHKIINDKLTVRDAELLAQQSKAGHAEEAADLPDSPDDSHKSPDSSKPDTTQRQPQDPDIINVLERLQYKFGTPVKLKVTGDNKGRVEIEYFSGDDLVRVFDLLLLRGEGE